METEKSKKKIILEKILRFFAKIILKKYKPEVVAITGSVGKTTTKEMAGKVLSKFRPTRRSQKNFNNEIGLPLTVIGYYVERSSIWSWLAVFLKATALVVLPLRYPKILVLEMGADQPGDIKYLCDFVPVSVGILTEIGISHLEKFKTRDAIVREKGHLLKQLPPQGLGVYNYDNPKVRAIGEGLKANAVSYGFKEGAQIRATDVVYSYDETTDKNGEPENMLKGTSFKINYQGKIVPVRLNHCIGKSHIYSAMAVFALSSYFDINLVEVAEIIKNIYPAPGRMSVLKGIKKTVILDDTYNSAPDSVEKAIETINEISANRKIVALGDMLELGDEEKTSHKKIGKIVANSSTDIFIAVGDRMALAADEFSKERGGGRDVVKFDNPDKAGLYVQNILTPGDLVLAKGSQGMRMEKIVGEIMANPRQKEKLLIRHDSKWRETEFEKP